MSHSSPLLQPAIICNSRCGCAWGAGSHEPPGSRRHGLHCTRRKGTRGSGREGSQMETEVISVKNDSLCLVLCCPPLWDSPSGRMLTHSPTAWHASHRKLLCVPYIIVNFYCRQLSVVARHGWPYLTYFVIVDRLQMPIVKLLRNLESQTIVNTAVVKYFALHHKRLLHSFSQPDTAESNQSPQVMNVNFLS